MADANVPRNAPASYTQSQTQNNGEPSRNPAPLLGINSAKPPSVFTSHSRPPYVPQFTAATQMILKRMKGESTSLSSALTAASKTVSVTSSIKPAAYEEVKRRLVMSMNTTTSMTMKMPVSSPTPPPPSTTMPGPPPAKAEPPPSSYLTVPTSASGSARTKPPAMSAIQRINSGLTAGGKPIATKPATTKPSTPKAGAVEYKVVKKTKAPRAAGTTTSKRKNAKKEDDSSSLSSLSDLSDDGSSDKALAIAQKQQPHTMTKSGRQVQKPLTYNPADMEASSSRKRPHYGKRTAEQALCKKCSRMHSPTSNQMVFCDGCNDGWHQWCHDPWISDEMVRDQHRAWYCNTCIAKREPRQPSTKKQKVEPPPKQPPQPVRESWAGKSVQQKRAYLLTLPQPELVALLMHSLELYPDLPIFPGQDGGNTVGSPSTSGHPPRSGLASSTAEGLFPRADANSAGQTNPARKAGGLNGTKNGKNGKLKDLGGQEQIPPSTPADDIEEEFDPLVALWPKPGKGLYCRLPPDVEDDEHLVDDGDYEAFSTIIFEKGKKVMENGMKV